MLVNFLTSIVRRKLEWLRYWMVTFLTTCLTVSTQYEDGQGVHSWIRCGRAKKLKERVARWLLACQSRCWVTTLSGSTPACAVWADEECGECGRSLWGRSSWTGRWLDVRTCAVWWQSRCRTRARASELWHRVQLTRFIHDNVKCC